MSESITLRNIKKHEIGALVSLCEKHALYEQTLFTCKDKKERLTEALFQANAPLFCLVVAYEDKLIGYMTFMKQFSTWDASSYLYMDCLFIEEPYRCLGIGKQLLQRLKEEAKHLKCDTIQFQTPLFNTHAINFYKKNGALSKTKERFFLHVK